VTYDRFHEDIRSIMALLPYKIVHVITLYDSVSLMTLIFFFSFLSLLEIRTDHSKFKSCPLMYQYFNFDLCFFILIVVLGLFVKIHNCDLLFFFKSSPHSFNFYFVFQIMLWIWISFSIQNSMLSTHFFFILNSVLILIFAIFLFWILLYNWFFVQFHHSTFDLLRIGLHDFSKLDASSLVTQVIS
jgi:hypothetical protein